jgi:hypothetical protein
LRYSCGHVSTKKNVRGIKDAAASTPPQLRSSRYIRYRDNIGYPRYGERYDIGDNQYSSNNLSYCPINRFLESVPTLRPTAGRVAWRRGPAPALAPFPVPGRSSLWTVSCCWGGWLVLLLRGCDVCSAVSGGLQSGAALIGVRLNVLSLPPCSSSPTVTGCRLGGFPVGRDLWGGERIVGGGVTPHQNWQMGSVGSSMSSSCLQGQVRFGGGVLLFILGSSLGGVGPVRGLRGGGRRGWCEEWARSG